ncbi:phage baseplate assembly protein V [Paenibacillus bovis]|uniref:Gp5/Type VI secretion system Vgr protein OB-fold domain-containing protein n=1 Tax=Paenibacillus bovis TaxID=1616788 RepID=A0A172ZBA8_9BACL|nr:phage baseplate assembly protein V [Paenibacillus bovis]ANF94908.1 hypothetical protein AR543_01910 [Paenibacillus bovis]
MSTVVNQLARYGAIGIHAPYRMVSILDMRITQKINDHGHLFLTAVLSDEEGESYEQGKMSADKIEIFDTDLHKQDICLFKGKIRSTEIRYKNGVYTIRLEAISYSSLLDTTNKNRSYQNSGITYYELFREIVDSYPHGDFIDLIDAEQHLNEFTLQYEETDWEFLCRMASRLNTGVIAEVISEYPRLWLGASKGRIKGTINSHNYSIQKSDTVPKYKYIEVQDNQYFQLGDVVLFHSNTWSIDQCFIELEKSTLKYNYTLVPEEGIPRTKYANTRLHGASLEGRVIDTKEDFVKVHLSIDAQQDKLKSCWFAYSTMYTGDSIGWYCMPEYGDTVILYFPTDEEQQAYITQAVRKKAGKNDLIHQPDHKRFHTRQGKVARFDPKEAAFSTQEEKIIIRLNQGTGLHVYSHHNITFHADEDIVLHGKKVEMSASGMLKAASKGSYIQLDGTFQTHAARLSQKGLSTAELKAYYSLIKEMNGQNYPQWLQNGLLKFKKQYYEANAKGDQKASQQAAEKAKQLRQQWKSICQLPDWAREQMNDYTAQWWAAHAINDKKEENRLHGLASRLRDNVQINALIRDCPGNAYKDANRLEEISRQYADIVNHLAPGDKKVLAQEAAELRSKYGVGDLAARQNLNKLAHKYPDSFQYKLPMKGEWDKELNSALYDFAKKYGLADKGYSREVLEVYLYQVANGILPWPKVKPVTKIKPATSEINQKDEVIPKQEVSNKDIPQTNYKDEILEKSVIEAYINAHNLKGNRAKAIYRVNEYSSNSIIRNSLSANKNIPLVFFFEGDGSYSHTQSDHPEGRYGASVIVVIDGHIKYTSANTSTLPDHEKKSATVNEGVYDFVGGLHRGDYPALRIRDGGAVSSKIDGRSYTATGINIHKGYNRDNPDRPTSTGCITIHKDEYIGFLAAVGVVQNSLSESPKKIRGLAIIDRKDRS